MKILVTGAAGYLGVGIVHELLEKGCQVVAVDSHIEHVDSRADRIECDLFKVEDPYNFFGKPDAVLHLAWRDGFKHQSKAHIEDFQHHYFFLEKLILSGIDQVCVMGSMHEIGYYEGEVKEDTPTNPKSLYGISKDALRRSVELLKMEHSFVFQWIRGFYIVGNTKMGCSIFSKITEAETKGEKEFPFTLGTQCYDFIPYSQFCEQVVAVLRQKKVDGIINCCSGKAIPLKEKVEEFIEQNHYSIRLKYGAFKEREYDSKFIWGNIEKIEQILKGET